MFDSTRISLLVDPLCSIEFHVQMHVFFVIIGVWVYISIVELGLWPWALVSDCCIDILIFNVYVDIKMFFTQ